MSKAPPNECNQPDRDQPSSGKKSVPEWLVVTLPAVLLYFVGWAYLHYYLQAFGIGISELDLDLQTILLYSLPPFKILFSAYWPWILGGFFLAWLLAQLCRGIPARYRVRIGSTTSWAPKLPLLVRVPAILVLLFLAVIACAYAIRVAALQNADDKWTSEGTRIEAMVKAAEGEGKSNIHSNYRSCNERRALDLIISDKEAYYILCISRVEPKSAIVFEVRRSTGLASARLIQRAQ